jgi:hypothetical protein
VPGAVVVDMRARDAEAWFSGGEALVNDAE